MYFTGEHVAEVRVEGRDIKVWLDDKGHFYAKGPDDNRLSSKNLDGLKAMLRKAIKAHHPICLEVTIADSYPEFNASDFDEDFGDRRGEDMKTAEGPDIDFFDWTITGRSGRRGQIRAENNENDTFEIYSHSDRILRRLTSEERDRLNELSKALFRAQRDFLLFREELTLGGNKLDQLLDDITAGKVVNGG